MTAAPVFITSCPEYAEKIRARGDKVRLITKEEARAYWRVLLAKIQQKASK